MPHDEASPVPLRKKLLSSTLNRDVTDAALVDTQQSTAYAWLMLAGIAVSFFFWRRLARRDARLPFVYIGALLGAFFGAKIVYLAAEGWLHLHEPNAWVQLATGKSILGALLGGYLGVEIAKKLTGYSQAT